MMLPIELEELERCLDYHFKDPALLQQAITHKSYLNEARERFQKDNERFEFLGDAVLDLVTMANVACGFHAGDPRVRRHLPAAGRPGSGQCAAEDAVGRNPARGG